MRGVAVVRLHHGDRAKKGRTRSAGRWRAHALSLLTKLKKAGTRRAASEEELRLFPDAKREHRRVP
jgi:hypothetical protein